MTTLTIRAALRAQPYACRFNPSADGTPGILLRVKDTTDLFADGFIARWKGPEAVAFCNEHATELIPGRCLDLQVSRIRCLGDEVRVDVLSCSLAPLPPSWQFNPGGTLKGQYQRVWTAPTVDPGVNVTNTDS